MGTSETLNTPSGNGNPNSQSDELGASQSHLDNSVIQAKAFSRGYSEGRSELLKKLNVSSLEELSTKLQSFEEHTAKEEAKALAEKEEKEFLAKKVGELERRNRELERHSKTLDSLRDSIKYDRVKAIAASLGVIPEALDMLVNDASQKVKWNDDYSGLIVDGQDSVDKLVESYRESKPFLFAPSVRSGIGSKPGTQSNSKQSVYRGSIRLPQGFKKE